jgi:peptidoglycan hydrolase-like protein with peptidoglycan-binding domain
VKKVQELLNKKGASLTVDGGNGARTIAAIRAFQSSIGIQPDGLISPNRGTWKGLIG